MPSRIVTIRSSFSPLTRIRSPQSTDVLARSGRHGVTFQSPDEDSFAPKHVDRFVDCVAGGFGFSPLTRIRSPQSTAARRVGGPGQEWFQSPDEDSFAPKASASTHSMPWSRRFQSPDEDSFAPKRLECEPSHDAGGNWFQSPDEDSFAPKSADASDDARPGRRFQSPDEDSFAPKRCRHDNRGDCRT